MHTACEKHSFILGVEVTAGNLHDSTAFDRLYGKTTRRFPEVKAIVADAGYKAPWICKQIRRTLAGSALQAPRDPAGLLSQ